MKLIHRSAGQALAFFSIICGTALAALGDVRYQVINIGATGGPFSEGRSINAGGQVVGYAAFGSGTTRPFLYSNGLLTDLLSPTLGFGTALGINDSGASVGAFTAPASNMQAFVTAGGTTTYFTALGNPSALAIGINNSGQVTGSSYTSGSQSQGFMWSNGTAVNIGSLGGLNVSPTSINNAGQVVGRSETDVGPISPTRAFIWQNGVMSAVIVTGGEATDAADINDSGSIVGSLAAGGGFLLKDGVTTFLGAGYGPLGLNNLNQVVGSFSATSAFIHQNGTTAFLNDLIPANSGWNLMYAEDINDSGQIVGEGIFQGRLQAFLLTPIAVPEPGFLGAYIFSAAILFRRGKRRTSA